MDVTLYPPTSTYSEYQENPDVVWELLDQYGRVQVLKGTEVIMDIAGYGGENGLDWATGER